MPTFDSLFSVPVMTAAARSETSPYQAIIVGGGTAGIVTAISLAGSGLSTILLDAGPLLLISNVLDTDFRFNHAAQNTLAAAVSASPSLPDGKQFGSLKYCLGGRGLFWTGATPRFDPSDFARWPFAYDAIEPFYDWAESFFGVNTRLGDSALAQMIIRRLRLVGFEAEAGPTAISRPGALSDLMGGTVGNALGPLLRSAYFGGPDSLITICTNAFVTRINHDDLTATGIEVRSSAGDRALIHGRTIVVACGGFESVRLALTSHVPDDSDLLGKLICDHIFVRASYPLAPAFYTTQPEQAVVYVRSNQERRYQIELHLPNDNLFALDPASWAPQETVDYSAMVRAFGPIQPRVENYIESLANDRPAAYVVHLAYSSDDLELQNEMEQGIEKVRSALPADIAQTQIMPPGSSHHESGGLIAGKDAASSVVDGYGRFHRLQNVVVADASAWPETTPYNPHLTIAAIARRQALALAERLRS